MPLEKTILDPEQFELNSKEAIFQRMKDIAEDALRSGVDPSELRWVIGGDLGRQLILSAIKFSSPCSFKDLFPNEVMWEGDPACPVPVYREVDQPTFGGIKGVIVEPCRVLLMRGDECIAADGAWLASGTDVYADVGALVERARAANPNAQLRWVAGEKFRQSVYAESGFSSKLSDAEKDVHLARYREAWDLFADLEPTVANRHVFWMEGIPGIERKNVDPDVAILMCGNLPFGAVSCERAAHA